MLALLFGSPRRIITTIAVVAALGFAAWIWSVLAENDRLKQKVFEQSIVIQQKQAEIETANKIAEAAEAARDIAKDALDAARTRAAELGRVRTRIIRAPVTDDGPIAPVVEKALEALRKPVEAKNE